MRTVTHISSLIIKRVGDKSFGAMVEMLLIRGEMMMMGGTFVRLVGWGFVLATRHADQVLPCDIILLYFT